MQCGKIVLKEVFFMRCETNGAKHRGHVTVIAEEVTSRTSKEYRELIDGRQTDRVSC